MKSRDVDRRGAFAMDNLHRSHTLYNHRTMRVLAYTSALLGAVALAAASKVVDLDTKNFDKVGRNNDGRGGH